MVPTVVPLESFTVEVLVFKNDWKITSHETLHNMFSGHLQLDILEICSFQLSFVVYTQKEVLEKTCVCCSW